MSTHKCLNQDNFRLCLVLEKCQGKKMQKKIKYNENWLEIYVFSNYLIFILKC